MGLLPKNRAENPAGNLQIICRRQYLEPAQQFAVHALTADFPLSLC